MAITMGFKGAPTGTVNQRKGKKISYKLKYTIMMNHFDIPSSSVTKLSCVLCGPRPMAVEAAMVTV